MLAAGWDIGLVRAATEVASGPGLGATILRTAARTLSARWFPIPIIVIFLGLALWRRTRRAALTLLAPLGAVGIADPVSGYGLKHLFHRLRPCHADVTIHTLVHCGPGFSFPSNHAANGCAAAVALVLAMRPKWPGALGLLALGLAVGASRVVVGVHYPTDVLGGWGYGAVVGTLAYLLLRWALGFVPAKVFPGDR